MSTLEPFPDLTDRMNTSLVDLARLAHGGDVAQPILDNGEMIPRIWDLTTIADPHLLHDTWTWLTAFVGWLNSQHAWYSADHTPPCWTQHPGLVRELGTLAALRYLAGEATDPTPLEEWHRNTLPSYLDRTRDQRRACDEKHQPWPGRAAALGHTRGYLGNAGEPSGGAHLEVTAGLPPPDGPPARQRDSAQPLSKRPAPWRLSSGDAKMGP